MADDTKCPVDHTSREAWLKKAAEAGSCPVDHGTHGAAAAAEAGASRSTSKGCTSAELDQPHFVAKSNGTLDVERQVSSIPRSDRNANWVYPSEQMFFDAMKRKNFDPEAKDMKSIIPIHNAVNERAWMEILKWEDGYGAEKCGGPKLSSFEGDASKLSPRARWKMFWGYEKPFDRHDWTVDRCGVKVEYVIDFYSGKPNPLVPEMPSFFLDARPKLNSFEGVKMRAFKFFGL